MPADVSIKFRADSRDAQRQMQQLQREVKGLQQGLGQTGRTASQAGGLVDQFGRPLREASGEAQRFNRVISVTGDELRQIATVSQRSADALDRIGDEATQTTRQLTQLNQSMLQSNRSTGIFTTGLGSLRNVLGGLGIAVVTHQLGQFSVNAVQAAGRLEQYVRATEQITGSAEAAAARIESLIEIANLPGLNFEALTRFSNRLIAAGVAAGDTDKILLTTGQTILSLGGTAATAELAMEQLIQAFQLGKVDFRDFRTIVQQIPSFLEAMGDVHGVAANLDGLHEAFARTGGSIRDLVIPVFDELARRFESPPPDSYIVVMDELQNAFFLASASIGDLFLPTVIRASQGLIEFFEAIRRGINDVTTLPEPIQEIVRGAQALYDTLQNVGQSIGGVISPPVQELASQLAGLLGAVLELAGALYNSLEPVLKGVYAVLGTVVAAVAQLVDHITLLIGGLTTAVNWVSQFWTEEERAVVSTDKLTEAQRNLQAVTEGTTQAMQNASGETKTAAVSTEEFASEINELLPTLNSVNAQLAAKRARYQELINQGANPAAEAMQQLKRQITNLETRSASLTTQVDALKTNFQTLESPINEDDVALRGFISSVDEFGGALGRIDTRFLSFHERTAAYAETIRELPAAITAIRDEFDVLFPTAARVAEIFDDLNISLVDTEKESQALNLINSELHGGLTTFAVDLETAAHNARLVNPAISDAVQSMRDYNDVLLEAGINFRSLEDISNDLTASIRVQDTAFDELREVTFDLDDAIDTLNDAIEDTNEAFESSSIEVREARRAFDDAERSVSHLGVVLGDATGDLENFDVNTDQLLESLIDLPASIESLGLGDSMAALGEGFGISFGVSFASSVLDEIIFRLEEGFRDSEYKQAIAKAFEPGRVLEQDPIEQQNFVGDRVRDLIAGIGQAPLPISVVELLREGIQQNQPFGQGANDPFQQLERLIENFFGGDSEDILAPLREPLTAATEALEDAEGADKQTAIQDFIIANDNYFAGLISVINQIGQLTGQNVENLVSFFAAEGQRITNQARQNILPQTRPGAGYRYNATLGGYEPIPSVGSEAGAPIPIETDQPDAETQDDLRAVFRFSEEQRAELGTLASTIQTARNAIRLLGDDSTPEEVIEAYTALGAAEAVYYDKQLEFIAAGEGIFTDTALETARTRAAGDLQNTLFSANQLLIGALEDIGFELVTMFTATSGLLTDTALDIRRIPEQIEPETPEAPEPPRDFFSFSREQRGILAPLEQSVTDAQEFINNFITEDSTPEEIRDAYTALANAEQILFNQQVAFINNATGIIESARQNALSVMESVFNREIRSANDDLVSALETIGFELVTALTFTSGILTGTALEIKAIPEQIDADTPKPEAPAELDTAFRFTAEQRSILEPLEGNVRAAEDFIRDFITEDSTPEEIRDAYTRLTNAEQALYDQQLLFINNAIGITEEARTNALTVAGQVFDREIREANQDLVDAFGDIGYELVNALTFTSGILSDTALEIQRIPEAVEQQSPEALPEPDNFFSFSRQQRQILAPLEQNITDAQDFIDDFITGDSSPDEIRDAYQRLTTAEQALYNQQVFFIQNATGITEDTRQNALSVAESIFNREIRTANDDLVDAFELIGFELVNAINFTSGILQGTALDIREIPEDIEQPRVRDIGNALLENQIQRAQFGLGFATDEADFEARRGILRQATLDYYSAEEQRINGLMLSENELQNLREDNALERERALQRIDNLDNEFAEDRIRREQEVADAAIQAAERAARSQEQRLRAQQQYRFTFEDIGIQSERGIENFIRGSDFVDTLSERFNRYFGDSFGLDEREQYVQDLAERFDVDTNFFGGGVSVGGQFFAQSQDLEVQSAEEIRRHLTPVLGFLGDIPTEEINDLILGIQSQQRDAIRGIEDENRENQRDSIFKSMNAEILNNSWKADIAHIANVGVNLLGEDLAETTDLTDTDATQSLTEVVVETSILETPVIQEAMLQATEVVLTVENLEIAALDAELSLFNETAFANMRAAEEHSAAADKYSDVADKNSVVADAMLNVANQLASALGSGIAGGSQPANLIIEWDNGLTTQVAGSIERGIQDGSILPFTADGGV